MLLLRDDEAVLTAAYFLGAVMGGSLLSLTLKFRNLKILDFCVELCDGIIHIHRFRTTFLHLSYNLLWDVVPRDNGNKAYLISWLLIADQLLKFWTLDNLEANAFVYNKSIVLPWIDWHLAEALVDSSILILCYRNFVMS